MATDVARLSFDPGRRYRGVVPQQGRVSLEAEQNEQRVIDIEERRAEIIDIVGPVGTPDDGYAVSGGPGYSIMISAGTMYVGGWRLELDEDLDTAKQPDWLDAPPPPDTPPAHEHIVLWVQDTDVTAVEDPALYEVALGGPDGAARTRLLQRVERLSTDASTCAQALGEDQKQWLAEGLVLDPSSMELNSQSRLLVTWEGDPKPANPCEPSSTGGYLGAENQCIRVQLTAVKPDGSFDFVWGYDDASFLYRVTADARTNPILTLDRTPVDDYHRPRAGQAVQALRSTADLASVDGYVEGYVAALGGVVGVLAAPYDPDTKTVQFPSPLPPAYTDPTQNPQLYLRVWEQYITGAQQGKPVSLTGTGMQVTITASARGSLHNDDFWCIGVRPATPTTVYPDRYLREAQPPDGPHQWVCPLAVIAWQEQQLVMLEDCRKHSPPLTGVDVGGCCTLEVHPSDAPRLQAIIDKAIEGRLVADRGDRLMVCFAPGTYELTEPIFLERKHSNLTLRGCNDAVVIAVAAGSEQNFGQGMMILADADNVTISGFEFTMPQVPAVLGKVQGVTGGAFNAKELRTIEAEVSRRYVSIAIRPVNSAVLEVDNCLFRFSVGAHDATPEQAQTMPRSVFGVGVFASGGAWGLRLTRNRFLHERTVPLTAEGAVHLLIGYLHVQSVAHFANPRTAAPSTTPGGAAAQPGIMKESTSRPGAAAAATTGQPPAPPWVTSPSSESPTSPNSPGDTAKTTQPQAASAGSTISTTTTTTTTTANKWTAASVRHLGVSRLQAILGDAEIVDNEFRRLTCGVVVVAHLANVGIRDNVIKDCYGGIWLVDVSTFAKTDTLGSYTAAGVSPSALSTAAGLFGAALFDTVLLEIFLAGALFPLPQVVAQPRGVAHFDPTQLAELQQSAGDIKRGYMADVVTRLIADQQPPAGAAPSSGQAPAGRSPTAQATVKFQAPPQKPAGQQPPATPPQTQAPGAQPPTASFTLSSSLNVPADRLAVVNRINEMYVMVGFADTITSSVRVGANSVDCALPAHLSTGAALLVFLPIRQTARHTSALAVDTNRLVSNGAKVTAAVLGGSVGTVNGNTVLGGGERQAALWVGLVEAVAIVGNVVAGQANLPGRSFAPPLDTWVPLNTIV